MNPFVSWGIAVAIVMAVVLGLFWLKGGKERAKPVAIFFAGWIVGAIAMYLKAMLVYKH
jgi:ABC-type Fe3+-siderophore transport system permease subunit